MFIYLRKNIRLWYKKKKIGINFYILKLKRYLFFQFKETSFKILIKCKLHKNYKYAKRISRFVFYLETIL